MRVMGSTGQRPWLGSTGGQEAKTSRVWLMEAVSCPAKKNGRDRSTDSDISCGRMLQSSRTVLRSTLKVSGFDAIEQTLGEGGKYLLQERFKIA